MIKKLLAIIVILLGLFGLALAYPDEPQDTNTSVVAPSEDNKDEKEVKDTPEEPKTPAPIPVPQPTPEPKPAPTPVKPTPTPTPPVTEPIICGPDNENTCNTAEIQDIIGK